MPFKKRMDIILYTPDFEDAKSTDDDLINIIDERFEKLSNITVRIKKSGKWRTY